MPSLLGCEDIIAESISLDTLIAVLKWSSHPYGSKWVHRQAVHFLCEELSQVMTSDVFYELSKDHLLTAIQSDYLQVILFIHLSRPLSSCVHKEIRHTSTLIGWGRKKQAMLNEHLLHICTLKTFWHFGLPCILLL